MYIICRVDRMPYMLIDFSDAIQVGIATQCPHCPPMPYALVALSLTQSALSRPHDTDPQSYRSSRHPVLTFSRSPLNLCIMAYGA